MPRNRNDRPDERAVSRNERPLTLLQEARVEAMERGEKPLCGSPLANSKDPKHKNYQRTCRRPAGYGTAHLGSGTCSWHAGTMASQTKAAAREIATAEVRQFKRFFGDRAEVSFEEALLEEMQRSVGVVRWMEEKIGAWGMDFDGLEWKPGQTNLPDLMTEHVSFRAMTVSDSEFAAWLRLYQIERRHLAQVSKAGIDAGIAKDMVLIYQRQADAMQRILLATLREFGVTDTERIAAVLPRVIREVTGRTA